MHLSETKDRSVRVNDWVAFMRDSHIVYARVQYIRKDTVGESVITTEGEVMVDRVLEVRS